MEREQIQKVNKKVVDMLDELLPLLEEGAMQLYRIGNIRDSDRIAKAIKQLRKVADSLE